MGTVQDIRALLPLRNILLYILLASASAIPAAGELVGYFPGLSKLIETADAIVILRIDRNVDTEGFRTTLYTTHDCYVYQTLKGDLHPGKTVRLQLMDARHPLSGYASGTAHLMFLAKKSIPSQPTDYLTLAFEGTDIRLSPLGNETMPQGKTVEDKIRNLIRTSMTYFEKQEREERRFLNQVLTK